MKTILYIMIAVMAGSILLSSIPMSALDADKNVRLVCTSDKVNSSEILKSAQILKSRFESFGVDARIGIEENRNIIEITFNSEEEKNKTELLYLIKGELAFYGVVDKSVLTDQIGINDSLFLLLEPVHENEQSVIIGYCTFSDISVVEEYISNNVSGLPNMRNVKFAWSKIGGEDDLYALYLLHNHAIIKSHSVEHVASSYNLQTKQSEIQIQFDKAGSNSWYEATSEGIGRAIALTMDGNVFFAPVIKSVITDGKCKITGDYSPEQAAILVALLGHGPLPLDFQPE